MSQPSQSNSQSGSQRIKIWNLKGGTMTVKGLGKRRMKDPFMTLELEFDFVNEKKPRTVGKHNICII